jgi:hypothetical protein
MCKENTSKYISPVIIQITEICNTNLYSQYDGGAYSILYLEIQCFAKLNSANSFRVYFQYYRELFLRQK